MKRTWFALVAAILLFSTSGCLNQQVSRPNSPCGGGQCGGLLGGLLDGGKACGPREETRGGWHQAPETGPAGPPTAAYAYPYYTLHGPRDFLLNNPPSLGR
jgi:hypothetical protein